MQATLFIEIFPSHKVRHFVFWNTLSRGHSAFWNTQPQKINYTNPSSSQIKHPLELFFMNPCLYIIGYLLGLVFLFVVNFGNMETNKKCHAIHAKAFLCPKLPNQGKNLQFVVFSSLDKFSCVYCIYLHHPTFFGANFCHLAKYFLKKTFLLNFSFLFKIICQNLKIF